MKEFTRIRKVLWKGVDHKTKYRVLGRLACVVPGLGKLSHKRSMAILALL